MDKVKRLRGITLGGPDLEPGERWDGPFRARILGNVDTCGTFIDTLIAAVEERQDRKWRTKIDDELKCEWFEAGYDAGGEEVRKALASPPAVEAGAEKLTHPLAIVRETQAKDVIEAALKAAGDD